MVGQLDTTVIGSLNHTLVEVKQNGQIDPIVELSNATSVGFYFSRGQDNLIRICNGGITTVWVEGRFVQSITNCGSLHLDSLSFSSQKETLFISFFAQDGLSALKVEKLGLVENQIMGHGRKIIRMQRSQFEDFIIVGSICLLVLTGFLISNYPGRISYLFNRSFSLKLTSYEFADTQLFSKVGISFYLYLSFISGFVWVYFTRLDQFGTFMELLGSWIQLSGVVLLFVLLKWTLTVVLSRLFNFRGFHHYLVFDFINVSLIFTVIAFGLMALSFSFGWPSSPVTFQILVVIVGFVLGATIIYSMLKFVNNTSLKKLPIITYLCATEIIPAILIAGWFFK